MNINQMGQINTKTGVDALTEKAREQAKHKEYFPQMLHRTEIEEDELKRMLKGYKDLNIDETNFDFGMKMVGISKQQR